jgi:hypothetical protein
MDSPKIYDVVERIAIEREFLKNEIRNDIKHYIYNVIKSPDVFSSIYFEHLPKYVASLLVDKMDEEYLTPEEILLLKENLINDNKNLLEYFYKDLTK